MYILVIILRYTAGGLVKERYKVRVNIRYIMVIILVGIITVRTITIT